MSKFKKKDHVRIVGLSGAHFIESEDERAWWLGKTGFVSYVSLVPPCVLVLIDDVDEMIYLNDEDLELISTQ